MHRWILGACALALASAACGGTSDDPIERAAARERAIARYRCEASLEVFPPDTKPTRPYRVLGPVDGSWGWTMESRFEKMRKKACAMGASALLDAQETMEPAGPHRSTVVLDRFGRPAEVVDEGQPMVRRTTAWAIVYTD